jgi:hypothetical protein
MPTVDETIAFIKRAHAGQVDKAGNPYWQHPVSVMGRLGPDATESEKLAALLHDVIEDTDHAAADLLAWDIPPRSSRPFSSCRVRKAMGALPIWIGSGPSPRPVTASRSA